VNSWIPYKTPKILKWFFNIYIWDFNAFQEKKIYLTFDDGPIPEVTEFVLDQLGKHQAKATFFCVGDNIRKHPEIFKQIISQGHSVGNHTMNHTKAWKNTTKNYLDNILKCEEQISKHYTIPNDKKLFRPPYGHISYFKFKKIQQLGYKIILWDILSKDWEQHLDPEDCYKKTLKHIQKGSIVVFHDSIKASEKLHYILPKVLAHFTQKGYVFESINL